MTLTQGVSLVGGGSLRSQVRESMGARASLGAPAHIEEIMIKAFVWSYAKSGKELRSGFAN